MGAIFFQYNLLAGILIAAGLLIYSRIAFTLSIFGFSLAWYFYEFIGADISVLGYSYIGFNYILTSIALGGFFIIPSRWSYLWLLWLLPWSSSSRSAFSNCLPFSGWGFMHSLLILW